MPHTEGHKVVEAISTSAGNKRNGAVAFVLRSIAVGLLLLAFSSITFVYSCTLTPVQSLTRHVGGIRLLAWTLKNASAHSEFQEVAALTAGRLTRHSVANQDAFVHAGGVDALHRLLAADWGEARQTAGVQAAAANALADVMASNTAAKADLIRRGGIEVFVQLAARGSTDRASDGAARALAVLLQPPINKLAQERVLNAGGTNALVALLQASPRLPSVENAIKALEGLIRDNSRAQAALVTAGGIQALDLLVESGEPRVTARAVSVLSQIDPIDF